jgi:hypothetical protein
VRNGEGKKTETKKNIMNVDEKIRIFFQFIKERSEKRFRKLLKENKLVAIEGRVRDKNVTTIWNKMNNKKKSSNNKSKNNSNKNNKKKSN